MSFHSTFFSARYPIALASLVLAITGCRDAPDADLVVAASGNLKFIKSVDIDIEDPSGLSLSQDLKSLWVVCNESGQVYRIALDGRIIEKFQTSFLDLEGIATIDASHLAFIPERSRTIVVTLNDGTILQEAPLPILGDDNLGPEGLAYDSLAEEFHIIKEKPGTWITLNKELEPVRERQLEFAMDYSSLSFDCERRNLWVMSDESRSVHVIDEAGQIKASFSFDIEQMEGLAVDYENQRLYIVSDALSKLYVFDFDLSTK